MKVPQALLGAKKTTWLETWNFYLTLSIQFAMSDEPKWTPEIKMRSSPEFCILQWALVTAWHKETCTALVLAGLYPWHPGLSAHTRLCSWNNQLLQGSTVLPGLHLAANALLLPQGIKPYRHYKKQALLEPSGSSCAELELRLVGLVRHCWVFCDNTKRVLLSNALEPAASKDKYKW